MRFFRGLVFALPISLGLWAALIAGCSAITRGPGEVRLSGVIDATSGADFARAMPAPLVVLDSDGGQVAAAAQMAGLIRASGANTLVRNQCASACVLLFAAGKDKYISPGGRIGVHRSTGGPATDAAIGELLTSFNVPGSIVRATQITLPSAIYWVTDVELRQWHVQAFPKGEP